ncbi:MAG: protein kinase [Sandaracinaceae bacterium]
MPILTSSERIGTVVAGRYLLERVLGQGGMGVVFEAEHTGSGRKVAVKMLTTQHGLEGEVSRRLLREARAAARLEHPNVVQVLDVGTSDDETPYLVLELLRGEALGDLFQREGPLDPDRVVQFVAPIVDALHYAHRRRIVHRDLKPDNVFLARLGDDIVPKLLDFGIAKVLDDTSTLRTATGTVMGTPAYMAPEQARGESDLGPSVDQWAMGVMMFELLSGRLPFEGDTYPVILGKILTQSPPKLGDVAPEVPPALAAIVDRMLERDPGARFRDLAAVAAALRADSASAADEGARARGRATLAGRASATRPRAHETAETIHATPLVDPPANVASGPASTPPSSAARSSVEPPPATSLATGPIERSPATGISSIRSLTPSVVAAPSRRWGWIVATVVGLGLVALVAVALPSGSGEPDPSSVPTSGSRAAATPAASPARPSQPASGPAQDRGGPVETDSPIDEVADLTPDPSAVAEDDAPEPEPPGARVDHGAGSGRARRARGASRGTTSPRSTPPGTTSPGTTSPHETTGGSSTSGSGRSDPMELRGW